MLNLGIEELWEIKRGIEKMKYDKVSRRMFLQGLGSLLPMPFLISLAPRELWAQSSQTIRRYISIQGNYDYGKHQNWFPSMNRPSQVLNPGNGDAPLYYQPLRSYLSSTTAPLSLIFGNHLNPYLNHVNIIRGLDQSTRLAHGLGHTMGNIAATDGHDPEAARLRPLRTIDQVLRDNTRFNPRNRDVAVLGNQSRSFRRDPSGNIVRATTAWPHTRGAFDYLFDGGSLPESGTTTVPVAHPRRDLLNNVMEDYTRVKNGRQISAQDRIALDNALDLIADIQRNLAGSEQTVSGTCRYRHIATDHNTPSFYRGTQAMRAYADMIVAAIMCDVTRVFSLSSTLEEWGANTYDVHPSEDFHQGHSHIPFSVVNGKVNWQYMGEIQNDHVRYLIAPLIQGLASATDPSNGQTYLHNSLVHYTLECSQVHGMNSTPCMLAGNAGGNLTSGYMLDYSDRSRIHAMCADNFDPNPNHERFSHEYVGIPLNRLFNTVLQSMGLQPSEYEDNTINTHFQGRSDGHYGAINNGISRMGGYGHWGPHYADRNGGWINGIYIPRQASFNLHHFKNPLVMPPTSA